MLGLAVTLFLLALLAALFGFNVIASAFAGAAQIAFWIFAVLFVISLLTHLFGPRRGPSY
jgi:uncharacterized membrane protein YtjA (UPF0391 family)